MRHEELQRIKPDAIIPLLNRLALRHVPQVLLEIYRAEPRAPPAPGAQLVFVVGVQARRVEDDGFPCRAVRGRILVPQVPVDEARFEDSALGLEWLEQLRDDLGEDFGELGFVGWPRPVGGEFAAEEALEESSEEGCPAGVPVYGLGDQAVAVGDVETEVSGG